LDDLPLESIIVGINKMAAIEKQANASFQVEFCPI